MPSASPLTTRLDEVLPAGLLWVQGRTAADVVRDRDVDRVLEKAEVPGRLPGRPSAIVVTELQGVPLRETVGRLAPLLVPGGVLALLLRTEGSGMWNLGRAVAGPYEALCESLLERGLDDIRGVGPHRGRALVWGRARDGARMR